MSTYSKITHGYFPDFCDQVIRGINTLGDKFEVLNPNIVNNPIKWSDSLVGEKNPSWRDQVRRGIDATTVMSGTLQGVKAKRCAVSVITADVSGSPLNYREFRWDGYPFLFIPAFTDPSNSVLSEARNQALRKFLSRANAIRTSVEGGQLLGEWKETVRAITNPLGALRQFTLRHVVNAKKRLRRIQNSHGGRTRRRPGSKGREPRSAAFGRAMSDTYLEFVFGWIPLVKDVNAAVVGLLDRYDQPDRVMIKGKGVVGYNESNTELNLFTDNFISAVQNRLTVSSVDYRFRASIKTGAVNGVRSVSRTLGLLPERFLPTVWELIPYTFVIDYFVNIGDIIESYAFQRSGIEWGTRTIRIKTESTYSDVNCRINQNAPPGYYPAVRRLIRMGATGGGATTTNETVSRVPISYDSLMPDLSIHLPFSRKPWLNLSALLTQKFCSLF